MISNYTPAEWKEDISYELVFLDIDNNGFVFPCSSDGEPILNPAAKKNYDFCMAHPEKFVMYNEVVGYKWRYRANASGTCHCGEQIELHDEYLGACSCPRCGRWYNLFGQELEPPSRWGDVDYDY